MIHIMDRYVGQHTGERLEHDGDGQVVATLRLYTYYEY